MSKIKNKINPHNTKSLKQKVFWVMNELEDAKKQRFSVQEIANYLIDVLGINVTRQGVEYALRSDKQSAHKNKEGYKLMESGRNQIFLEVEKSKIVKPITKSGTSGYVNLNRIDNLNSLKNCAFDVSKLVRLCEEINIAFLNESYFSIAMLVRTITDHVPPIFSKKTFAEVTNNFGSKSFKDSMKNLDNSSRKISDSHLHTQIRKKEVLPNFTQVDFTNDLDVLLAEVYRILK